MKVDHLAECPEISPVDCEVEALPAHMHHQQVRWMRAIGSVSVGLGKGWQLKADLPYDVKFASIDYSLDGAPYDPPYQGIHHRDETLVGLSDGTLWTQYYRALGDALTAGVSAGSSLPIGRTEEDPFALATQSIEHQHFQRGTGTFVPNFRGDVFWSKVRWRAMGWGSLRLPLYENHHGYQPGSSITYGLAGGYRLRPETQVLATGQMQHDSSDAWDGDTSMSPGRDLLMVGAMAAQNLTPGLILQGSLTGTVWQQTRGHAVEDQLVQRILFTVGLNWSPEGREDSHGHDDDDGHAH
jgi:hypothetical protein